VTYGYLNCFVAGDIPENPVKWALGINSCLKRSFMEGLLYRIKMVGKQHEVLREQLAN
jgi:hypothetical protein